MFGFQASTKAETDKAAVDDHVTAELTKAQNALGSKMYVPSAILWDLSYGCVRGGGGCARTSAA